jgi:small-conductance mechanosensitive channel
MPNELTELVNLDAVTLWRMGKSIVTLGGLLSGLAVVVIALLAARLAGAGLRRLRSRANSQAASIYIVEKLVTYGLVTFGLIAGLSTVGMDLSSLAVFAGALGVGIGLGLQGIVKEFVAGLVLVLDRLIRIGDYIELPTGERGVVQEVGPRATRVRNNDDIDVMVPNSRLIEAPVTNWTHGGETRRLHVPFPVAYGVDKESVRDAVLKAAHAVPFTMEDTPLRRTQVWLVGFGDNGLKFELVVWPTLEAVKRPNAAIAAYTWAVEEALRKGGFEIPLPQQEVRLRRFFGEEGDAALDTLKLKKRKTQAPAPEDKEMVNDAAIDLLARAAAEPQDEDAIRERQPPGGLSQS